MYRVWIEFSDVVSLLGPGGAACDVRVWIESFQMFTFSSDQTANPPETLTNDYTTDERLHIDCSKKVDLSFKSYTFTIY